MNTCLYGIILRGKSESIKAYRKENVISFHSSFARNYFKSAVRLYMSDVHSRSRRIRKLYKTIEFFLVGTVNCGKSLLFIPYLLPFGLNRFEIVCHISPPAHCFPYSAALRKRRPRAFRAYKNPSVLC